MRLIIALIACSLAAQTVDKRIDGSIVRPRKSPPDLASLRVPQGFQIRTFATGLGNIRILAVADNGDIYATRRQEGDVILLRNGSTPPKPEVVLRRDGMHGLAIHNDQLYLATVNEVLVADRKPDGTLSQPRLLISDLPDGGQHPNRTLAIGPDGKLYVSVGSTCNACTESSKESAALLRMAPDGTGRSVFASGLRNTIGFAWHPETKALWGFDHGIDWLGNDEQSEELNLLENGKRYGWPYVYGKNQVNPQEQYPAGFKIEDWMAASAPATLEYTPHAAPMQMVFYTANELPVQIRNDAFVTMRGSWNRRPPSGYEVVHVRFAAGKPMEIKPFLTGFLKQMGGQWAFSGRPVGLAIAKDGGLLVGDDVNGVLYKVTYDDGSRTPAPNSRR
ncbi:MAG: PQQ-dependent sugar dehydrogenase [Bryobacterales bacterium]|nr:PQQ-dependent sugar dehydrogenase [Bryobacterales bacterium]